MLGGCSCQESLRNLGGSPSRPTEHKSDEAKCKSPSAAWRSKSCATQAQVLDFGEARILKAAWRHAHQEELEADLLLDLAGSGRRPPPVANLRSVAPDVQKKKLVSPSHQGSCGSCWAVAANVHSLLKMVLIFSAMAGASVCFPHCCSECGCGRRRGPLPAEAQCTKHQDGLSRARHRDPAEPQRMTAPAAESKDAQTSVACCRGKF